MKKTFLEVGMRLQWEAYDGERLARSGTVTVAELRSKDFIVTRHGLKDEKGKPARMFCEYPTNKKDTQHDIGSETVTHKQSGTVTDDTLINIWVDEYKDKETGAVRVFTTKSIFKNI